MSICDLCECNNSDFCSVKGLDVDFYDTPKKCEDFIAVPIINLETNTYYNENLKVLDSMIDECKILIMYTNDNIIKLEECAKLEKLKRRRSNEIESIVRNNEANEVDRG